MLPQKRQIECYFRPAAACTSMRSSMCVVITRSGDNLNGVDYGAARRLHFGDIDAASIFLFFLHLAMLMMMMMWLVSTCPVCSVSCVDVWFSGFKLQASGGFTSFLGVFMPTSEFVARCCCNMQLIKKLNSNLFGNFCSSNMQLITWKCANYVVSGCVWRSALIVCPEFYRIMLTTQIHIAN